MFFVASIGVGGSIHALTCQETHKPGFLPSASLVGDSGRGLVCVSANSRRRHTFRCCRHGGFERHPGFPAGLPVGPSRCPGQPATGAERGRRLRTLGGIDALIALQGIGMRVERRRRAVKHGRRALDALDELKSACWPAISTKVRCCGSKRRRRPQGWLGRPRARSGFERDRPAGCRGTGQSRNELNREQLRPAAIRRNHRIVTVMDPRYMGAALRRTGAEACAE